LTDLSNRLVGLVEEEVSVDVVDEEEGVAGGETTAEIEGEIETLTPGIDHHHRFEMREVENATETGEIETVTDHYVMGFGTEGLLHRLLEDEDDHRQ
jgi:hypothetical protein